MSKNIQASLIALFFLLLISCQPETVSIADYSKPALPEQPYNYKATDAQFADLFLSDFTPLENPITNAGASLGRVLFYDKMLSVNNSTSCGSCHFQNKAFADISASSDGFRGGKTHRNSLAIFNSRSMHSFFWDMRATSLEEQVLMPVADHLEMGMERLDDLEKKLALIDYYPDLFKEAFGSSEITNDRISRALAQFLRSIVSSGAKYDEGLKNNFANFNSLEMRGMELFTSWEGAGCINCHSGNNFDGWSGQSANIGLDMDYADEGVPMEGMEGFFKVPSLRNVALTAPYMHDGRFETLREVIDHYNNGVQPHPNLDWRLNDFGGGGIFFIDVLPFQPGVISPNIISPNPFNPGPTEIKPRRLDLSENDKKALITFLETLTDHEFTRDPKYSDPFR